ncbi:hypothetical protein AKJ16_DCAP08890 [Drosera capensis]
MKREHMVEFVGPSEKGPSAREAVGPLLCSPFSNKRGRVISQGKEEDKKATTKVKDIDTISKSEKAHQTSRLHELPTCDKDWHKFSAKRLLIFHRDNYGELLKD